MENTTEPSVIAPALIGPDAALAAAAEESPNTSLDSLQFQKAEIPGIAEPATDESGKHCVVCSEGLNSGFFRLGARELCPACAARWRDGQRAPSKGALARGIFYGFGAAIAGAILIAVITAVTGYQISLVAIAVGWMVARAFLRGTRGLSGRRCQWLAVAIAYFGITMSTLPEFIKAGIELAKKDGKLSVVKGKLTVAPEAAPGSASSDSAELGAVGEANASSAGVPVDAIPAGQSATTITKAATAKGPRPVRWGLLLGGIIVFVGLGLLSPVLLLFSGFSGIINAVIVFFGLRQAWQMMANDRRELIGPLIDGAIEPTPV